MNNQHPDGLRRPLRRARTRRRRVASRRQRLKRANGISVRVSVESPKRRRACSSPSPKELSRRASRRMRVRHGSALRPSSGGLSGKRNPRILLLPLRAAHPLLLLPPASRDDPAIPNRLPSHRRRRRLLRRLRRRAVTRAWRPSHGHLAKRRSLRLPLMPLSLHIKFALPATAVLRACAAHTPRVPHLLWMLRAAPVRR